MCERLTEVFGGSSFVLGAPAPGRPNGFHTGGLSAKCNENLKEKRKLRY